MEKKKDKVLIFFIFLFIESASAESVKIPRQHA